MTDQEDYLKLPAILVGASAAVLLGPISKNYKTGQNFHLKTVWWSSHKSL
jgi:hypothetical protein